ncbi:MAG: PEP/pyruvate-binding domain-containing protein [Deltaproteobacteria bacterium]|nr:PEP/pyruvate-binding domain-containing protein [Deltaproteobacteria bacterium]
MIEKNRKKEGQRKEHHNHSQTVSTGLNSLDKVIGHLRVGDNVVWQVDTLEDYEYFIRFFVKRALKEKKRVVYMQFGNHEPIIRPHRDINTYRLDPSSGFEFFSTEVHNIITKEGTHVYYIFDSLSNLQSSWATDLMMGNFFTITCPYLFELNTVAHFAIIRERHSFQTVAAIRDTTQVLIDIYNVDGNMYIHPIKLWKRYSPTMFLPHKKEGQKCIPVVDSVDAAKLQSSIARRKRERVELRLDYWDRLFMEAEELTAKPWAPDKQEEMIARICRIMMTREPRMSILVRENFSLEDLLEIRKRLLGTGFLGGKTLGMLLARKILERDKSTNWGTWLEPHDSFYVGSDLFYTYLVQNGWWRLRMKQKTREGYFAEASALREKMLHGTFPDEIKEHFMRMLEYFGQSPIIVRSSSLLEDSFGNAFAGKYESIFCVNQGTPEERYLRFEDAVRTIYASMMNENALSYRRQRNMDEADEQMALLIQRVSGSYRNHYYFPDLAGVGTSYNTFVWKKEMKPTAGMLRLVFGLGTRAVNRVEGDYPRIVALDAPLLRPHAGMKDTRKYSQHDVDVLDLTDNTLKTAPLFDLMGEGIEIDMERIGVRDHETDSQLRQLGITHQKAWVITFDNFLSNTSFVKIVGKMLKKLETIYEYPVDIEFTVNFTDGKGFKINVVQCRPLQTIGLEKRVTLPERVDRSRIIFESEGSFFGGSISQSIGRIIYVKPESYTKLTISEKYDIARIIGRLNRLILKKDELPIMLLGPGRWGSTTPSLGVPVNFSEINNIAVLGEIAHSDGNLMPELSFGTHFFQDLVETGIFYVAIFPENKGVYFDAESLEKSHNQLGKLIPDGGKYSAAIKVFDIDRKALKIVADIVNQKVLCYYG